ncbi:MAG: protein kinase [Myxococcaceae bacterium]
MSCPPENELLDFLDGKLPSREAAQMRRHIAGCDRCSRVLSSATGSTTTLLGVPDPEGTTNERPPRAWSELSQADGLLGTTVGEYRVEEVIGVGGMGVVYRGRHPMIGREVAIKVLRPELAANESHTTSMLKEARAATQIGHPGIVDVFAFGELPDGRQYMVMEHLKGEPLNRLIRREAPMRVDKLIRLFREMLAAVEAAHDAGVVHRDLKPSNLFIHQNRNGPPEMKLLDFGLAKRARAANDSNTGMIMGTPGYMAPEQVRGQPVDARADLYALGVMAFELATGKRPFDRADIPSTLRAQLEDEPPSIASLRPGLSPALEKIIYSLMEKDRELRPANAQQVRAMLDRLAAGSALPRTAVAISPVTRRRLPFLIGGAAALLLLVAAVVFWLRAGVNAEPPPPPHPTVVTVVEAPVPVPSPPPVHAPVPEAAEPHPAPPAPAHPASGKARKLSRAALQDRVAKLRDRAKQQKLSDPMFELLLQDAEKRLGDANSEPAFKEVDVQLDGIQTRFLKR